MKRARVPSACHFGKVRTHVLSLFVSRNCGCLCVCGAYDQSASVDVQGTARRIRKTTGAPSSRELRVMGKRTWKLFYTQLWTFSLGIAFLGTALLLTYGES